MTDKTTKHRELERQIIELWGLESEATWEPDEYNGAVVSKCAALSLCVEGVEDGPPYARVMWIDDSATETADDSIEGAKRKAIAMARNLVASTCAAIRELERELEEGPTR